MMITLLPGLLLNSFSPNINPGTRQRINSLQRTPNRRKFDPCRPLRTRGGNPSWKNIRRFISAIEMKNREQFFSLLVTYDLKRQEYDPLHYPRSRRHVYPACFPLHDVTCTKAELKAKNKAAQINEFASFIAL